LDKKWLFDSDLTRGFTEARQSVIRQLLGPLREQTDLVSTLDVGCGVGYFSKFLLDMGFRVVAVDGREENVQEGERRYPQVDFLVRNAEELDVAELGAFDFVLCVGLLYHLENPFRAIRRLYSLTCKVLVVESMCAPGIQPCLQLVDESTSEDQGLTYVAFYPTESCLVKMLYRAGFVSVYGFENLPEHPLFQASLWKGKERTMLVASRIKLQAPGLVLLPDVPGSWETLSTPREKLRQRLEPLSGFLRKFRAQIAPRNPGSRKT
jgi:SAM-dependent methyltransferase